MTVALLHRLLDTQHYPRKSWVVWEEDDKYPNVIIELLSESTEQVDRRLKKQIYQDTFHTPEYFWFDLDQPHPVQPGRMALERTTPAIFSSRSGYLALLHARQHDKRLVLLPKESAQMEQQRATDAEALLARY